MARVERLTRIVGCTGLGLLPVLVALAILPDLPVAGLAQESEDGGLPPLIIDKSLRLEDSGKADRGHLKINQSCFVCHNNYQTEPMVTWHAKEGVGCVDCHGESLAHRNDEDNITPPDVMFPLEKVDASCQDCHDEHDVWPREVLTRWKKRCPEKLDFSQVACTDCHGAHRLPRRIVQWDKRTGELLIRKPAEKPAGQASEKDS